MIKLCVTTWPDDQSSKQMKSFELEKKNWCLKPHSACSCSYYWTWLAGGECKTRRKPEHSLILEGNVVKEQLKEYNYDIQLMARFLEDGLC